MSKASKKDVEGLKEMALLNAEFLYHYNLIARSVGRDDNTLLLWRKQDPEFDSKLSEGRMRFIKKQMGKAKPEFLLERLERELFGQKVEFSGGENPIRLLLEAYGIKEGENSEPQDN